MDSPPYARRVHLCIYLYRISTAIAVIMRNWHECMLRWKEGQKRKKRRTNRKIKRDDSFARTKVGSWQWPYDYRMIMKSQNQIYRRTKETNISSHKLVFAIRRRRQKLINLKKTDSIRTRVNSVLESTKQ